MRRFPVIQTSEKIMEDIRSHFPDVDISISNDKKVFLKSPSRIAVFKEKFLNLFPPPQPVITRWGTWLEAAEYYAKYFNEWKWKSLMI